MTTPWSPSLVRLALEPGHLGAGGVIWGEEGPRKGWGRWEGEEEVGMEENGQAPAWEQGGAAGGGQRVCPTDRAALGLS